MINQRDSFVEKLARQYIKPLKKARLISCQIAPDDRSFEVTFKYQGEEITEVVAYDFRTWQFVQDVKQALRDLKEEL